METTLSPAKPESLSDDEMLERLRARDASSNGRFFFGVVSTGVYCLPSCKARPARPENLRFFPNVESARSAGLRPCRRCHPDDFARGLDPVIEEVEAVAAEVRNNPAAFPDVAALVARSGYGLTRLSELFRLRFEVSPAAFLQQARVEHAKRLLRDRAVNVAEVGYAAGFASASAFHASFKRLTGRTPLAFRQQVTPTPAARVLRYDTLETPLGPFSVALDSAGALVAAWFGTAADLPLQWRDVRLEHDVAALDLLSRQLNEYFAGARKHFDIPLAPEGTEFQKRFWRALAEVPFGETTTYGAMARELASSPRAVGRANATNPICLILPCHRVIGTDGSLTGYAYGVEVKRRLLEHERAVLMR